MQPFSRAYHSLCITLVLLGFAAMYLNSYLILPYVLQEEKITDMQIEATAQNRTPSEAHVLIYNRVPTGNPIMQNLLKTLAKTNKFVHNSSRLYSDRHFESSERQMDFVQSIHKEQNKLGKLFSHDRHVFFIDFTKFNLNQPVYINMLQNPVETFISTFYYVRSPKRWAGLLKRKDPLHPLDMQSMFKKQREIYPQNESSKNSTRLEMPHADWLSKNLKDCVLTNDSECSLEPGTPQESFVAFFCGHEPYCPILGSTAALQQAKFNLENFYSVVGIVDEELETSMTVMEEYIPAFLRGMRTAFSKMKDKYKQSNNNPHLDVGSYDLLEHRLRADMEIYHFARQRLFRQKRQIEGTGS